MGGCAHIYLRVCRGADRITQDGKAVTSMNGAGLTEEGRGWGCQGIFYFIRETLLTGICVCYSPCDWAGPYKAFLEWVPSHVLNLPFMYRKNFSQRINQRHHFADKGLYRQSYGFSSSYIRMWELNHKEGWAPKNWCFQTVVLEKTLESPLDCMEIKPVHPKGDQSWIFIGRTYAEAKAPIPWPLDAKSWLTEKDPDAGKDWGQEKKGATEDEMLGWHHRLNGHEFEQAPGDGEGQGGLACCRPWGRKESDTTERLNNNEYGDGEQDRIEGGQLSEASGWLPRYELHQAGWDSPLALQRHRLPGEDEASAAGCQGL